jgi:hypothetical protein
MFGVIGPCFFEENNWVITVDSECYWHCNGRCKGREMYGFNRLVQMAKKSMTFIGEMAPGCLISQFIVIPSEPYFPDLRAPDLVLWGYLKSKVNATQPHSTQQLKDCITEGI